MGSKPINGRLFVWLVSRGEIRLFIFITSCPRPMSKEMGFKVIISRTISNFFRNIVFSTTQPKGRPSVLWCYKKELGFSTHRKKRMKMLQRQMKSGTMEVNESDPFELFICATEIRWTYYKAGCHKLKFQIICKKKTSLKGYTKNSG